MALQSQDWMIHFVFYLDKAKEQNAAQLIFKKSYRFYLRVSDGSFKEWQQKGGTIHLDV